MTITLRLLSPQVISITLLILMRSIGQRGGLVSTIHGYFKFTSSFYSFIMKITLHTRWPNKNWSSRSQKGKMTTVLLVNLWYRRRNMVMMYLSQGIPMRLFTPSSGRQNKTLNFTLTWLKTHIMILLFLKHRRGYDKVLVPMLEVILVIVLVMVLLTSPLVVKSSSISFQITENYFKN